MLREGGLLVSITSQGILNSYKNEPIRKGLMQKNNLISAIRLPNNLFTDYAGTEVGSDLIILQKNTGKQSLSEFEELFCQSQITQYNTPSNTLFQDNGRIVHTDVKLDTDPYGKPVLIYTHKDAVEGISRDLKQMLSEDFGKYLNVDLYKGVQNNEPKITPITANPIIFKTEIQSLSASIIQQDLIKEEKQLSIFDLFENAEENVVVAVSKATIKKKQPTKRKRVVNGHQPNLFSGLM